MVSATTMTTKRALRPVLATIVAPMMILMTVMDMGFLLSSSLQVVVVNAFSSSTTGPIIQQRRARRQLSSMKKHVDAIVDSADEDHDNSLINVSRRNFMSTSITAAALSGLTTAFISPSTPAYAGSEGEDLTQQLFNPDGSLKEGVESEIKFRKVQFTWNGVDDGTSTTSLTVNRDGKDLIPGSSTSGSSSNKLEIRYEYPLRWSDGSNGDTIYFDRTEGTNAKACKRITVYRSPDKVDPSRLEQATKVGVAKAFNIPKSSSSTTADIPSLDLDRLYSADIISAKTRDDPTNGNTYYEFDMASAPTTCGTSKENLGLGFCPYDLIYLVSATVVNERLYCIIVECDDTKIWKLDSSELKRLRSSFTVQELA